MKVIEYMGLGKPVVAPDTLSMHELLAEERSGLMFDPTDESALYDKLKLAVEDPELRARLGAAGKAFILESKMTWEQNACRVVEIAKDLGA